MLNQKEFKPTRRTKKCLICKQRTDQVDYLDTKLLHKFISPFGRIQPASRTGLCRKHQRAISKAIKNARNMSLIKY